MKGRKGFTLIELLVVIAIIAVLAAILFPVFAKARKAALASDCQSNMKQIGSSLKMYLSDWNDTYPTNRNWNSAGVLATTISTRVLLTPPGTTNADGSPARFKSGVNWVEALYPYVESVSKDGQATWRCQAASTKSWPTNSGTNVAAVTYAFNSYLCEQPEGVIKGASNLLCVRELDRWMHAELRPSYDSTGGTSNVPQDVFLDSKDEQINFASMAATFPKQHGNGSNILFADGHVKGLDVSSMPESTAITSTCWDTDTNQWYNFGPTSNVSPTLRRSIAITP